MCDAQQGTAIIELEPEGPIQVDDSQESEGEHNVLHANLQKLAEAATKLCQMINSVEFDEWMIADLTVASANVDKIYHLLESQAGSPEQENPNMEYSETENDTADYANMGQMTSIKY
jgi:hypothetical protein